MPTSDDPRSLDAALDELYGVEPEEFVAVRKRLTGDLRAAGEKDAAKSLQAARRPTAAAWALNQMSRHTPELVDALLDRSREVQAAQSGNLEGGRQATRDAIHAQRAALTEATDGALARLSDRANDAYRAQILATLHAAAADPSIGEELQLGRLTREVSGSTGFPEGPMLTLVPDLAPERTTTTTTKPKPSPKPKPTSKVGEPDAKRPKRAPVALEPDPAVQEKAERAARRRREQEQERERAALEQAQRRLDQAEAAAQDAQHEATRAEAAAVEARAQILQLQHDLDAARRESRTADDTAARARREATRLARMATKLRSKP